MDARRLKSIEQKASDVLHSENLFFPNFDVSNLIQNLGIKRVAGNFPDNISGASMTEDGMRVITINGNHHPNRRRFTEAHELGHIILAHDTSLNISEGSSQHGQNQSEYVVLFRNDKSSLGGDWREIEANQFAASLLMPKELVEIEIAKFPNGKFLTEIEVSELARVFGVSQHAMTIRLSKLGYL